MKNEVKPITMTALLHCRARVTSCRGREMAVEKSILYIVGVGIDGNQSMFTTREDGQLDKAG